MAAMPPACVHIPAAISHLRPMRSERAPVPSCTRPRAHVDRRDGMRVPYASKRRGDGDGELRQLLGVVSEPRGRVRGSPVKVKIRIWRDGDPTVYRLNLAAEGCDVEFHRACQGHRSPPLTTSGTMRATSRGHNLKKSINPLSTVVKHGLSPSQSLSEVMVPLQLGHRDHIRRMRSRSKMVTRLANAVLIPFQRFQRGSNSFLARRRSASLRVPGSNF
jgi:hypothetical protein